MHGLLALVDFARISILIVSSILKMATMRNRIHCPQPRDLEPAAKKLLEEFPDERIFALHGPMGAGKTTLVKAFSAVLDSIDEAASPTFALVNEYLTRDGSSLYHFDFYRIKDIGEVYDIGYEDYFFSGAYCFLEWPERIAELLPEKFVYIAISEQEDGCRVLEYSQVII